jgi:hypothetical protein
MRQYISDIITEEEICKWLPGNRILICSQTGSGKSQLIKDDLYKYAKKHNNKILLMSNRILLRNQNLIDIENKQDIIESYNYQSFESKILDGSFSLNELFNPYYYVVYDESQYFYADSLFNKNTMALLDPIRNTPKDKVFIFVTATPQALIDYQPNYDFVYTLEYDYSYIEKLYFYTRNNKESTIIKSIVKNIPKDEKILYFGSNAQDNYNLSLEFEDASFICSPSNKMHEYSNQKTIDEIVNYSRFSSRIVFATKILDNGINIKDESLRNIFIDILDPISFIQSLGRKRIISKNDKINLYLRFYNKGNVYYASNNCKEKIDVVKDFNELDIDDFTSKYLDKNVESIISTNYKLNEAKYYHYRTQKKLLSNVFKYEDRFGYKRYICKLLNFDYDLVKNANLEFEELTIKQLLEEYLEVKMFKEEQDIFKDKFFENIFTPKNTNYSFRGIVAANGIIKEDKLKFEVFSRQERSGKRRGQYYWTVKRK